jgi:hypothetical protein
MNGSLFTDILIILFLRNFARLGSYDIQTTPHIRITTKEQFQKIRISIWKYLYYCDVINL